MFIKSFDLAFIVRILKYLYNVICKFTSKSIFENQRKSVLFSKCYALREDVSVRQNKS